MLFNLLQEESNLSVSDLYDIKWATASLYSGGADTVRITKAVNSVSPINNRLMTDCFSYQWFF